MERWRVLQDVPREGAENMAVDEAVLSAVRRGASPATLRLYEWKRPTLSIGYTQKPEPFEGWGGPLVRRLTGGRAVLHDMELTYSVLCGPESPLFRRGVRGAYKAISICIARALAELNLKPTFSEPLGARTTSEACFHTPSGREILIDGRKLVGSAQRRFNNGFLQHGSILFGVDGALTERLFGDGVLEKMIWLGSISQVGRDEFREVLTQSFSESLKVLFEPGALSDEEDGLKRALVEKKYSTDKWNIDRVDGGSLSLQTPVNSSTGLGFSIGR